MHRAPSLSLLRTAVVRLGPQRGVVLIERGAGSYILLLKRGVAP